MAAALGPDPARRQNKGGAGLLLLLGAAVAGFVWYEENHKGSTGVSGGLIGMPAGTLYQDNSGTIGIVNPIGQRQGFSNLSLVTGCGYDLDRLVQISGARREAIPLGPVISVPGTCPPQSTEESPPVGL